MSIITATKFPVRYLTTDILIVDVVCELAGNLILQQLVEKHNLIRGSKYKIADLVENYNASGARDKIDDVECFEEFVAALTGFYTQSFPGGSASNMLRTIALLGGPELVKATFIGVLGNDLEGSRIQTAFNKAHIDLRLVTDGLAPQTAISIVIKYPDGQRTIVTFPGNAKQLIKPNLFTEEMVAETDVIPLQGSILSKFDPEVFYTLLKYRWQYTKELHLSEPTSAFRPEYFDYLQTSADRLTSNTDELGIIMKTKVKELRVECESNPYDFGLAKLLDDEIMKTLILLQNQQRTKSDGNLKMIGHPPQIAMITDGKKGAWRVTSNKEIELVEAVPDNKVKIVNATGCGDTAMGTFEYAYRVVGMEDLAAIELAMKVAAAKLQCNGTVMDDPRQSLRDLFPNTSRALDEKLANLTRANSRA